MANGNLIDEEFKEDIDVCRTCGVYYLRSVNYLRDIFNKHVDEPEMQQIRLELASWKLEVNESDGRPQNICNGCIHEFKRFFTFRKNCIDTQQQFEQIERQKIINTEIPESTLQTICGFIYIDDLSDDDEDYKSTKYKGSLVSGFDIPHLPLKEEHNDHIVTETPPLANVTNTGFSSQNVATLKNEFVVEVKREIEGQQQQDDDKLRSSDYDSDVEIVKLSYADDLPLSTTKLQLAIARVDEEPETMCKVCQYVATNQALLRQHIQRIHEVKDMVCHICGKTFQNTTPARLKFHLKWHKLSKHIKCAQCGFYCSSRNILGEHTRALHSKIKCNICGKLIYAKKFKTHLRKHEIAALPQDIVKQKDDSQTLSRSTVNNQKNSIKVNMRSFDVTTQMLSAASDNGDDNDIQPYEHLNALTLQDSNDKQILSDNTISSWNDDKPPEGAFEHAEIGFCCASCNEVFDTIEQLGTHYKSHKKYAPQCHICGKAFHLTFKLNQHLKTHAKARQ